MDRSTDTAQLKLDEALFALPEEGLKSVGSALGRTRLRTFISLRWIAVAGQTAAVLFVHFGLNFELPLAICLAVIAASAWLNVFLEFALQTRRLASEMEAGAQLAFDVVQLSALVAATGGLANPFDLFLLAPVTIAAVSLRRRYALLIAALTLVLAATMPLYAAGLPWRVGEEVVVPRLLQWGQFIALTGGVAFFALSAVRVNQDEARLVRALDAAQVVMAKEQRLSALGAMAAMTAHELGTPLATIHLVAREMAEDLPEDSPLREDATLLVEQAERCRTILQSLAQQREAGDIVHAQMPFSALIEEAAAPHKGLGVDVDVRTRRHPGIDEKLPVIRRSPEILHALGAFIENAVSFADTMVWIEATWDAEECMITIRDDGPGFSADVMPKLGEPYVSQRGDEQAGGGDMGLGFFIAKTLIERTGGRVATRNRTPPGHGATVQITWPRVRLEPNAEHII
ncbi:MAG: ActS/PrrB/RegB family redox-sensitive histidine kinase [Pseudomonadota bacterium]